MAKTAFKVRPITGPALVERPLSAKEADARRKLLIDRQAPPIAGSMTILEDEESHTKALEWKVLLDRRAALMQPINAELARIKDAESLLKLYFAEKGLGAETIAFSNLPMTIDRSMTDKVMVYREAALRGTNKVASPLLDIV